jgi:XTP/dITP diphosphohydrolase
MKNLVYATTNPGKFKEVSKFFQANNLQLHLPSEYGVDLDVNETGSTLEENATLKAEAYLAALPSNSIVIGDDTGVEIDALGGEPGIHTRRWKGYRMEDQEIIDYCLERMEGVPIGERGAQFRTVLAVACQNREVKLFDGIFRVNIRQHPHPFRDRGFPFRPLIEVAHPTHRIHAIETALPYLRQLLAQA